MTQQAQQQSVLAWLKDAHAMEAGGALTLTNHAEAAGDYPEVQAKLREHAQTTRRHAELVEGCIERLGGHPSSLKEAVGAVASKIAGVANLPAQDTVVKNALGDLAAENFEIASYVSLIAAAEHVGDEQTASVCQQILADERAMAAWLEAHIPTITREFLVKADEGGGVLDQAKQAAKNLGEQGSELAGKVTSDDARNALLVSGALLAGAGAALLIGRALQGGSPKSSELDQAGGNADPAYAGATSEASTAQSAEHPPVLSDEGTFGGVSFEDVELVVPAETLTGPDVADEALSLDELIVETFGGDAELLSSELQTAGIAGASSQAEPAPAPELHDGSQTDAPLEDAGTSEVEVWLMPGPFSGLGPLAYDSAGDPLGEAVASRLTLHGQVDATHIEVVIDNGEVLLEGTVDNETTKRLAEEAVSSVDGVSRVQNLLQTRPDDGL